MSPPVASDYDDILKFSNCTDFIVEDLYVSGGQENAIDICRGANAHITDCILVNNGTAAVVAKGAFQHISIADCVFSGKAGWDIELGQFDNYWTPGRRATGPVVITHSIRSDKKPVRVICWDADRPIINGANVKVTRVPKFIWYPYFLFRYLLCKSKETHK